MNRRLPNGLTVHAKKRRAEYAKARCRRCGGRGWEVVHDKQLNDEVVCVMCRRPKEE